MANVITGNNNSETINGTNLDDQISGLGGNDTIFGNDGGDALFGNDGNDKLDGGNGSDFYIGGAGFDTFIFTISTVAVNDQIEDFVLGEDRIDVSKIGISDFATIQTLLGDLTGGSFGSGFGVSRNGTSVSMLIKGARKEDLLGGDFIFSTLATNDIQTGGDLTDYFFGGLGNDTISGGLSFDRLYGEGGDDILYGNNALDTNGNISDTDYLYGGAGNDLLFGGSGQDQLFGGDGGDKLDGGIGSDFLTGGAGNDTFIMRVEIGPQNDTVTDFDTLQDKIDVSALGISDFDTIKALSITSTNGYLGINYRVSDNNDFIFFNSVLPSSLTATHIIFATASTNNTFTGNTLNNDLYGGLGNDKLSGGLGNDRLFGEQGDDLLYGNDATNPSGAANDGQDLLYGGAGNDQLFSGGDNDTLSGGSGDDILTGGTGNSDTLDGGSGADTASYLGSATAVSIGLWSNTTSGGDALGDFLVSIENLTGSQFNDTLVGNALANVLDGAGGADYLNGREGNDSYFVDNSGDTVSDRSGTDTVNSKISYTLGATLENLTLLGSGALNGNGNALNNVITGNTGNNTLNGLDGIDTVSYATASLGVTVTINTTAAQNTLGAGVDTLLNFENLTGSGFNDILSGSSNNNMLNGGAGADKLTGSAGADSFVFNSKLGMDTVTDFAVASDKLQFSQAGIRIGDGDTVVEGAIVRTSGAGGFANSAEWVMMQQNIVGTINTATAATAIGSATANYALNQSVVFVVDDGAKTGVFVFTAANTDAVVSAAELTQIALLGNTAATALADYGFIA